MLFIIQCYLGACFKHTDFELVETRLRLKLSACALALPALLGVARNGGARRVGAVCVSLVVALWCPVAELAGPGCRSCQAVGRGDKVRITGIVLWSTGIRAK